MRRSAPTAESCQLLHAYAERALEESNPRLPLWRRPCFRYTKHPSKGEEVSSHWKFEVHVKTPGEEDDEQETVERFAQHVQELADDWRDAGLDVSVRPVERN